MERFINNGGNINMDKLAGIGVLFCLPFIGALVAAGTVAAIVTPVVAVGTAAVWSQLLKGLRNTT